MINQAVTNSYSVRDERRGGTGILHRIDVDDNVSSQTINFRHESVLGTPRKLTADPVMLSGAQWRMFMERGHGLHATSLVTLAIANLGRYIAEVEKQYGLYPQLNEETGEYLLSDEDLNKLQKLDNNAYEKYLLVKSTQKELRQFYEKERNLEPNNIEAQEILRSGVLRVLDTLRSRGINTSGRSSTAETLDHIVADAEVAVEEFEWPLDADVPEGTRRRKITEKDQLVPSLEGQYLYDPRLEPASAAGSRVFPTHGMGATARDNFAHCFATAKINDKDARNNFKAAVKKIAPSKGLGLPPLSDPLFGEGGNVVVRSIRPVARFIVRAGYAAADLSLGACVAAVDAVVAGGTTVFNRVRNLGFVKNRFGEPAPDRRFETGYDAELVDQSREIAQKCLAGNKDYILTTLNLEINNLGKQRKKGVKLESLSIFELLIQADDADFDKLVKLEFGKEKQKRPIISLLAPYHSLSEVKEIRSQRKAFTERFTKAYTEVLTQQLKKLEQPDVILQVMQKAQDAAFASCQQQLLIPEGMQGPAFLRANLLGNVYQIGSTITGVLENMGRQDPKMATAALAVMGVQIAYVAMIAAHGASVTAASSASKFAAYLTESHIFPLFYQGVMPVHPGDSTMKATLVAFVNGLVMGKAAYMTQSLAVDGLRAQGGFTEDFLSAFANNPIESAILAAGLYAMGHAAIVYMHEQAALGSWKVFDELTSAGKLAAIISDHVFALMNAFKAKTDGGKSVNLMAHEALLKGMTNLVAWTLFEELEEVDRESLTVEVIAEKIKASLEAAQGQANDAMVAPPRANATLSPRSSEASLLNGQQNTPTTNTQKTQEPSAAKKIVKGLARTLIGTALRAAHGLAGILLLGPLARFIAKRLVVSHETMRTIEKVSGYDNAVGLIDGARAVITWPGRVIANLGRTVVTAFTRSPVTITGNVEENISRAGTAATRKFTGATRAASVKRPDDVPWYRSSMAKVVLADQPVSVPPENMLAFLAVWHKKYKNEKSIFNTGFSGMMRHVEKLLEGKSDNHVVTALDVLKAIFPHETTVLEKMMDTKGIGNDREGYLLASLQKLFAQEMIANQREHKSTLKALQLVYGDNMDGKNVPSFDQNLLGFLLPADFNWTEQNDPIGKLEAEVDEIVGAAVLNISREKPKNADFDVVTASDLDSGAAHIPGSRNKQQQPEPQPPGQGRLRSVPALSRNSSSLFNHSSNAGAANSEADSLKSPRHSQGVFRPAAVRPSAVADQKSSSDLNSGAPPLSLYRHV